MSEAPLSVLLIEIDEFADYCAKFGAPAADHARHEGGGNTAADGEANGWE
ncbi:MAG TPA: hypothetical protein VGA88_02840 [Burkholderiales bacterium]